MRSPLRLAMAQPACVPYDVEANALAHATAIRAAASRIVVFPELSMSGYEMDAPALSCNDQRLAPIIRACAESGSLALVGAPLDGDYIAMLAIDGSGARPAYRKVYVADEEARFRAGPEPAVLEIDGWRLGLAICRDTGIPQHQADTAALGIDAYLAGTLMFDHETDKQNERAQRIARQYRVWVGFASFAGQTGSGYERTAGRSGVWAPDGELVAQAGPCPGEVVSTTIA